MALREVNLIPAGLLTRRRLVRHMCFWGVCLFVSLIMIFGFFLYRTRLIRAQQPALQSLDEIQMHLGQSVSEIKRIQTELQRLNQQRVMLDKITKNRSYCQVLWKLSEIFNDEAWLTQLTIDRSPAENRAIRLGLTGLSFSNATLGNFINQISLALTISGKSLSNPETIPPSSSFFSTRNTFRCGLLSSRAADIPAIPPPMTSTSSLHSISFCSNGA